jgi:hypothetical protein
LKRVHEFDLRTAGMSQLLDALSPVIRLDEISGQRLSSVLRTYRRMLAHRS